MHTCIGLPPQLVDRHLLTISAETWGKGCSLSVIMGQNMVVHIAEPGGSGAKYDRAAMASQLIDPKTISYNVF